MRIRLIAWPRPGELEEFDLARFRLGGVYELPVQFASLLLISGCAELVQTLPPPTQAGESQRKM
jgi:hypothetical protein